jgi:hypothetical protein
VISEFHYRSARERAAHQDAQKIATRKRFGRLYMVGCRSGLVPVGVLVVVRMGVTVWMGMIVTVIVMGVMEGIIHALGPLRGYDMHGW